MKFFSSKFSQKAGTWHRQAGAGGTRYRGTISNWQLSISDSGVYQKINCCLTGGRVLKWVVCYV
jgi:hypothetical protein